MTADVQRGRCNYGHTAADHERAGACERPPVPGPGFSPLVADVVGEALARHAVACQGCGALVLRNLNAIEQHRRHDALIADAEKRAAAAALRDAAKDVTKAYARMLLARAAALDPAGAASGETTWIREEFRRVSEDSAGDPRPVVTRPIVGDSP